MDYKDHLYALVVAGGGGTRLWPLSRNLHPKQFLTLFEEKTLTRITVDRFKKILPLERIYIVTVSSDYKVEILKELPDFPSKNIIVEPVRRDTAAAHGIGALYIHKMDPDAVIINDSADRLVHPLQLYLTTILRAASVAYEKHVLVTLGVKPRYPNVGLGHIKRGKLYQKEGTTKFFSVDSFVEKPKLALAKKFTESKLYYWNAGQYVWRADDYLSALKLFEPELSAGLENIGTALGTSKETAVLGNVYESFPLKTKEGKPMSVDYAVSERAKNLVVASCDFYWTDIGDWKEVWENLTKDESGNVLMPLKNTAEVISLETSDSIIHTEERLVAVVGVENLIVIDTKDALLVASKSHAQSVKKIVEILKERKATKYL
jgi:mannose-1-phosphate guanylyltransferase